MVWGPKQLIFRTTRSVSIWIRRHVSLSTKARCRLVEQENMQSCWRRRHVLLFDRQRRDVFLFSGRTCILVPRINVFLVQPQDTSSCPTRRCVHCFNKKTCEPLQQRLFGEYLVVVVGSSPSPSPSSSWLTPRILHFYTPAKVPSSKGSPKKSAWEKHLGALGPESCTECRWGGVIWADGPYFEKWQNPKETCSQNPRACFFAEKKMPVAGQPHIEINSEYIAMYTIPQFEKNVNFHKCWLFNIQHLEICIGDFPCVQKSRSWKTRRPPDERKRLPKRTQHAPQI